jgi:hypothetical protein
MKRLFAMLALLPTLAWAGDGFDFSDLSGGREVGVENAQWQVGVAGGYAFIQDAPVLEQTTTDIFAAGQEVHTTGKVHNGPYIGLNVYRRLTPVFSVGMESDYQPSHKIDAVITQDSAFDLYLQSFGITNNVTSNIAITEAIPCAKYTLLMDNWRLHLMGGVGWAMQHVSNSLHFVFSDGTDISFDQDGTENSFAARGGAGVDFLAWDDASFGIDARYNYIFSHTPLKMITPTLHFDYHF